MSEEKNRRETGARKYPANTGPDPSDQFSQAAANNEKPHGRFGLARKQGEVDDKTRQSEGQNPPGRTRPSFDTEENSGASNPIAEGSREAKAPKRDRGPDAYAKDRDAERRPSKT